MKSNLEEFLKSPSYKNMQKFYQKQAKENATPKLWSKDEIEELVDWKLRELKISINQ